MGDTNRGKHESPQNENISASATQIVHKWVLLYSEDSQSTVIDTDLDFEKIHFLTDVTGNYFYAYTATVHGTTSDM